VKTNCLKCGKLLHEDECGFRNPDYSFTVFVCPYCRSMGFALPIWTSPKEFEDEIKRMRKKNDEAIKMIESIAEMFRKKGAKVVM